MSLVPVYITGYSQGLMQNKKPYLIPDQAFPVLENAYVWRERVIKREGIQLLGILRRVLTSQSLGSTSAGTTFTLADIFTTLSLRATEPNAELEPGTLVITVSAPDTATFTDRGDGTFSVTGAGVDAGSYINYETGQLVLQFTALTGGATVTANLNYFPHLPVMGIVLRDITAINNEQTIWFDTKYAYVWTGTDFAEFITGTTWNSSDSDFFWAFNYRGAADSTRLMFVTNFVNDANNPMRYTDGTTWTTFAPLSNATSTIWSARLIISYYGRLLLLNTWEGLTGSGQGSAANFFNRCRFSQQGSPIATDAFQEDIFGKGGFLDAPTNEAIISAQFIKNTLIVTFEQTTWQLRYVGEYGIPFIWERVSADFGSESTFSTVLFDNHMLAVGDKAITGGNAVGVDRIDLDIPEQVFTFKNANNGVKRIFGVRNYPKELVYWNYPDSNTQAAAGVNITYPNKVMLYNYRNNTWAIFRDSVTAFGTFQLSSNITWDSVNVFWDSETVTWEDDDTQSLFPSIVSGNQQGFVHIYQGPSIDNVTNVPLQEQESLIIQAIDLTTTPIRITSPNHNLQDGEIIYITDLQFISSTTFLPLSTDLNDNFYRVVQDPEKSGDVNVIAIQKWNGTQYVDNFSFTPVTTALYVGGGRMTLIPKLNIFTKDINIFQQKGLQTKLSYIDFLMQPTQNSAMTVNLFINASMATSGNVLVGNTQMSTVPNAPFYTPASDYAWFRFYATLFAQFFNINITYDDSLMNTESTHKQGWTMYAIQAWCRPGGKNISNT